MMAAVTVLLCSMLCGVEPVPYEFAVKFGEAASETPACAMGVLHSLTVDAPAQQWLTPLHLKSFRGQANDGFLFAPGFGQRLERLGMTHVQVVVSDAFMKYTYAGGAPWPGDGGDWSAWEAHVRDLVAQAKLRHLPLEYDIWNEPNIDSFWKRDRARLFETWRRAVRVIREADPKAAIVGPSITRAPGLVGFDSAFLESFLLFAREHDALPDVLSWHELIDPHGRDIPLHVEQMRRFMAANGIAINRYSINEIQPSAQHRSPGVAVSYFVGLRKAGVESAMRSCWPEDGTSGGNCGNASLDGLLTTDAKQPRAIWWAWRACADFGGELVRVQEKRDQPKGLTLGPWHTLGGFRQTAGSAFEEAFAPEPPGTPGKIDLTKWTVQSDWRDGYPHDLAKVFTPRDGGVAGYLYRTITVDEAGVLPVYLNSDDGIKLWLNEQLLLSQDKKETDRWIDVNPQHAVALPLRAGVNHLLLKITNRYAFYAFYFSTEPTLGIDVLATRNAIVLGSTLDHEATARLICSGINATEARVRIQTIPDTGPRPMPEPPAVEQRIVFQNHAIRIDVTVPPRGACLVTLQ